MPYCTQTDITNIELTEAELLALTDDDKIGQVHAGRVAAAIEKAGMEIDSYCGGRYAVPFSPVPAEIKFLSATMSAYWLCRRRGKVTESMLDKYTKALARLKAISKGDYSLNGAELRDTSGIGSTIDSNAVQTFTRSKTDKDGNIIGDTGSMDRW